MRNEHSNSVYVVALRNDTFPREGKRGQTTYIEVVEKHKKYFHPRGKRGHLSEPPNYIAFRYRGMLLSIHHVDGYDIFTNFGLLHLFPNQPSEEIRKEFFLYDLGPAIRPERKVPTGNLYGPGHHWCDIDLLLTCETVKAARDATRSRHDGT